MCYYFFRKTYRLPPPLDIKGAACVFPFSRETGYFLPFEEDFPEKALEGGGGVTNLPRYSEYRVCVVFSSSKASREIKKCGYIILGVPKKGERSIFVTLIFENIVYFDFIRENNVF